MDIAEARIQAENQLNKIIASQPGLFTVNLASNSNKGTQLASYCSEFIEVYAKYLISRS
jgi:hypothetical protein